MKIFHEAPISIMNMVSMHTDGEYCLPHLLDINQEYRDYFLKAKSKGRYIIMDNSMHELGRPYDENKLMEWVYELKPDEFIVPDKLGDEIITMKYVKEWIKKIYPSNTTPVSVIQARHHGDFYIQYDLYKKLGYKKICIPYGLNIYEKISPNPNKWIARTNGRIKVIKDLFEKGFIKDNDRIHLLGCNLPWEFINYLNIPQIESVDTSNPIMAAIESNEDYNLISHKPQLNLNKCFDWAHEKLPLINISNNLIKFKKLNNLI